MYLRVDVDICTQRTYLQHTSGMCVPFCSEYVGPRKSFIGKVSF